MHKVLAMLLLALLASALGCTSQTCRPCGPGFLGNIFIPQGIAGVDFRDACHEHDACYTGIRPRKECDVQFRDHMLCDCQCSTHPRLCKLQAWRWYVLTRIGGGPGYGPTNSAGCDCCCCESDLPAEASTGQAPVGDDEIATPTLQ